MSSMYDRLMYSKFKSLFEKEETLDSNVTVRVGLINSRFYENVVINLYNSNYSNPLNLNITYGKYTNESGGLENYINYSYFRMIMDIQTGGNCYIINSDYSVQYFSKTAITYNFLSNFIEEYETKTSTEFPQAYKDIASNFFMVYYDSYFKEHLYFYSMTGSLSDNYYFVCAVDEHNNSQFHILYDKGGIYFCYPLYISYANIAGFAVSFNYDNSNIMNMNLQSISSYTGEKICFEGSEIIIKRTNTANEDVVIRKIDISYQDGANVIKIYNPDDNALLNHYTITKSYGLINVLNVIENKGISVSASNDVGCNIEKYINGDSAIYSNTLIEFSSSYDGYHHITDTTITDFCGKKIVYRYYEPSNHMIFPLQIVNSKNEAIVFDNQLYDVVDPVNSGSLGEYSRVIGTSNPIAYNSNSLINSITFQSNKTFSIENDTYPSIIGEIDGKRITFSDGTSGVVDFTINKIGKANDYLTFTYYSDKLFSDIKVYVYNDDILVGTYYEWISNFEFENDRMHVIYITPNKSYNKVKISFEIPNTAFLSNMNLIDGVYGRKTEYDTSHKVKCIYENNSFTEYVYNENNYVVEMISNCNHYRCKRDEKNNVIYEEGLMWSYKENEYNEHNNLTIQKVTSKLSGKESVTLNEYEIITNNPVLNGEFLFCTTDENNIKNYYYNKIPHKTLLCTETSDYYVNYKNDEYGRCTDIVIGDIEDIDYDNVYNELDPVDNTYEVINKQAYDSKNRITDVEVKSNVGNSKKTNYYYNENNDSTLTCVQSNNNGIKVTYEYDKSDSNSGSIKDVIKSKWYGESENRIYYQYDSNNNLIKVEIGSSENKVTEYSFTYDSKDRLVQATDRNNNQVLLEYDGLTGEVKKIVDREEIVECDLIEPVQKVSINGDIKYNTHFSTLDNISKGGSCFIDEVKNSGNNYSCFFTDSMNLEYCNNERLDVELKCTTPITDYVNLSVVDNVPVLLTRKNFRYEITDEESSNCISVMVWAKLGNRDGEMSIVSILSSGNISLKVYNQTTLRVYVLGASEPITIENIINVGGFNFIGITAYEENDILKLDVYANEYHHNYEMSLGDNSFTSSRKILLFNTAVLETFDGCIAGLVISDKYAYNNDEVTNYYIKSKQYLINKVQMNYDELSVLYEGKNYYNFEEYLKTNDYDICTLHNTFRSYKNLDPIKIGDKAKIKCDSKTNFIFDEDINRMVYSASGNDLIYKTDSSSDIDEFTVVLKIKPLAIRKYNFIFELKDLDHKVALYFNEAREVYVLVDSRYFKVSDCYVNLNEWNIAILSFNSSDKSLNIKINDENNIYEYDVPVFSSSNTLLNVCAGKWGSVKYPLYGNAEMLAFTKSYKTTLKLTELISKLNPITYTKGYNDLGRMVSSINDSYYCYYQYLMGVNNKYTSLVSKQIIKLNESETREYSYEYDTRGNITKVYIDGVVVKQYFYNCFGQLTREVTRNLGARDYTYDKYGNITSKNGLVFTYEAQTNKLIKVTSSGNSIDIAYNISGYMSSITGSNINYSLVWTGNKLSIYNLGDVVINYEYDYTGRRIKKIINNNGTEIITKYYYEGDNLIKEVINNTEKDEEYFVNYIYDNNGLAIGFEYNNNCYYYVRDITGLIERVIDKEGVVVITYTYDAYGVITSASGSLADINSIKYKGYYYDIETGWFWLSSRYYSPELCRFISPDDIEYLDPESVNGLNLYCYCKNNPIMYADPSGHFTIAALIISFVASVAFEIIEDAMDGELFTDDSHDWKDYLGAGISGILGGMSGAAGVVLGLFGDLADAAISGNLAENGLGATLKSIVISNVLSFGTEFAVKGIFNSKQIGKLTSDAHANKKLVKSLGGSFSFKKNGKSIKAFKNAIKSTDWIAKRYTAQLFGELVSSSYSLFKF